MAAASHHHAFDKLRWAKKHFDTLRSGVEGVKERDAHTVSVQPDAKTGEYSFYVHGLEVLDPDWGLIAGDCIHNARCALDHLMVRLVALVTGRHPREISDVQFPIYRDPGRFAKATGALKQHSAFRGYLTRIEELQPYNAENPSIWGENIRSERPSVPMLPHALDQLCTLDNIDKHRVVHAVWSQIDAIGAMRGVGISYPDDFTIREEEVASSDPLEDGAKIGAMRFTTPLPHDWMPDEMDVKRAIPLQVAIESDPSDFLDVLKTLRFCIWGVECVVAIFAPVFERKNPPLPVTAIPELRLL